jgi:hypothetical protein
MSDSKTTLFLAALLFLAGCDDHYSYNSHKSMLGLRLMECRMLLEGREPESLNDDFYIPDKFEDLEERQMVRKECTK